MLIEITNFFLFLNRKKSQIFIFLYLISFTFPQFTIYGVNHIQTQKKGGEELKTRGQREIKRYINM